MGLVGLGRVLLSDYAVYMWEGWMVDSDGFFWVCKRSGGLGDEYVPDPDR